MGRLTAPLSCAAQRAAAQTFHAVDSSVALVLDAPMRATGADAAVHAPPATDPTSGPTPGGGGGDEEAPHDRSSGTLFPILPYTPPFLLQGLWSAPCHAPAVAWPQVCWHPATQCGAYL